MIPGKAQLTYYIFEGLLVGWAGGCPISMPALAGGGGGSTSADPNHVEHGIVNNPYMTHHITYKDGQGRCHHGGPLPPGRYTILRPDVTPRFPKRRAVLLAAPQNVLAHRRGNDFRIHGRGVHGSDGCIVVPEPQFGALMDALEMDNGGMLQVLEALGSRFA
jgi:hypothetical protein